MSSYTFINSPLKRTQDGSNNSYVADYSQISGLEAQLGTIVGDYLNTYFYQSRLETIVRECMNSYFYQAFINNVSANNPVFFDTRNNHITIGCNSDSQPSSGVLSDIEIGNDAGLRSSRIPIMSNSGGSGNQTSWSVGTVYATLDNGSQIDISSNVTVTLHSSNTNIAYVTDDLKIISSGNVSGQTTITATYTYSYNGVTKTKTTQSTLTVYDLAISSIQWTSTSAIEANAGSKPNMGTITVIWNDNSQTTVSSTNSNVTLYTNSACTVELNYNNAISNQSIWAKYNGKNTTNNKKLTLNAESQTIESIAWSSVLSLDFTMNDANDYDFGDITINYSNGQQETITTHNNPNCKFVDSKNSELDLNRTYTKRPIWCVYTDSNNRSYVTTNSKRLTLSEPQPELIIDYIRWSSESPLDISWDEYNPYKNFGTISVYWNDGITITTVDTYYDENCKIIDSRGNEIDLKDPRTSSYNQEPVRCVYMIDGREYTTQNSKILTFRERPVISEIRWEETTSITSTVGSKPNMGRIRVIWSDNSEDSIGSYQGDVSLYTNSECTIPLDYNNAISNQSIWAKFQGKITTNSKKLTLTPQAEETYYWYIGTTNPSTMTSISPVVTDTSSPGWRAIGTTLPTYSSSNMLWNGAQNNILFGGRTEYYIALPNNSLKLYNSGGDNEMDGCTSLGTKVINNVTYYVYKRNTKVAAFGFNIY